MGFPLSKSGFIVCPEGVSFVQGVQVWGRPLVCSLPVFPLQSFTIFFHWLKYRLKFVKRNINTFAIKVQQQQMCNL